MARLHSVLLRPRIPPNVGTIGRTCVGVGSRLHLVRPFGFDLGNDKALKRAGLDYWPRVDLNLVDSSDAFVEHVLPTFDQAVFFSKQAKFGSVPFHDFRFDAGARDVAVVLGSETEGMEFLPEQVFERHPTVYLPMSDGIRSYNLSNVHAVTVFEALRQRPDLFRPDLVPE